MLRALAQEHAIINGERLTGSRFDRWYAEHRTHMLNTMENFYQEKMLAGFLTFNNVRAKLTTLTPTDFLKPGDKVEIALNSEEIEHVIQHLASWYVRDRRIERYNAHGQVEKSRSLEKYSEAQFDEDLRMISEGHAIPDRRLSLRRRRREPEYR